MASLFGKCWNNFVLLAAAVLWAGCSEVDKNADKTLEQEKGKTEQSLDVKKEDYEKLRRDSVFKASIDSVLKSVGNLSTHGTTTLYGVARDCRDCPLGLEKEFAEKLIKEKAKGVAKAPAFEELSLERGVYDDKVLFIQIIRRRTPGLRHIYNKHIKKSPSFSGTIVFRLNINAGGAVQKVQIDSTTTGNRAFDEEIRKAVGRWNFQNMNSGVVAKLNTDVVATFPVQFYEEESLKQND